MSVLDPYLAASIEKALYPNTEILNGYQKALLDSLHHFIFSAYSYAQGLYLPFDGEWDEDKRDEIIDSFNEYTEDVVSLVQYIHHHGRDTSLRGYVTERSQSLLRAGRRRTFFFAHGGDTKAETEEYVFNLFLALLGLWTVGSQMWGSDDAEIQSGPLSRSAKRVDYGKMLPYRPAVMENITIIRETFGLLVGSMGNMAGMDLIRSLQDFDATSITEGPFRFTLTRDISRHLAVDGNARIISLFCTEAVAESDSPERLRGNVIAKFVPVLLPGLMVRILNLDGLDREHALLHTLLFSTDESRQIAFSLGLVPPRKSTVYLRLSAFPNYAPHLTSLRRELTAWQPRHFKELFIKGWRTQNVWFTYALIVILTLLGFCFILAVTGTIGVWIMFRQIIA
jgi:hypothetical protein